MHEGDQISSFTQTFDHREYPTISRTKLRKRQTYCSIAILQSAESKSPEERLRFKAEREHREDDFVKWEKGNIDSLMDPMRIERQNAILAKLDKLGWKETEITEMCGGEFPTNLAGFWTARKLSAAEWWSIKPKTLLQLNDKREQVITGYTLSEAVAILQRKVRCFLYYPWAFKNGKKTALLFMMSAGIE